MHTERQHWTSHNEVPMFLPRPLYLISECKRILSAHKSILTRAVPPTSFDVLTYKYSEAEGTSGGDSSQRADCGGGLHPAVRQHQLGATPCDSSQRADLDAPTALPNIGNACYFNALLQCLKLQLCSVQCWLHRALCRLHVAVDCIIQKESYCNARSVMDNR